MSTGTPDPARAALALATLRRAEVRTGARPPGVRSAERPALTVPQPLREILPDGVRAGSIITTLGSTALMLEMLGTAMAGSELWTAVVGQPHIGVLAAHEAGVDLSRVVLVPAPGPDAVTVLAALLDGVDLLVVGPNSVLLPEDRKRLAARARERGTVIFSTSPWPGAHIELTVTGVRWRGIGTQDGRLLQRELTIERSGRGGAVKSARLDVLLPTGELPTTDQGAPSTTADNSFRAAPDSPLRLVG